MLLPGALPLRILAAALVSEAWLWRDTVEAAERLRWERPRRDVLLRLAAQAAIFFVAGGAFSIKAGLFVAVAVAARGLVRLIRVPRPWELPRNVVERGVAFAVMLLFWRSSAPADFAGMPRAIEAAWGSPLFWGIAAVYGAAIWPTGSAIGALMRPWLSQLGEEPHLRGLRRAGSWIGALERLLTISFLLVDRPSAIAVLIVAKGVFRFGEIKDSILRKKETSVAAPAAAAAGGERAETTSDTTERAGSGSRREAEYILIGSMLSFGAALLLGWLGRWLLTLPAR